jgi:hypothetical protein
MPDQPSRALAPCEEFRLAEGRPLVDSITASRIANMKELRPPSSGRSEIRVLLVFDPWRAAILLVAGDKSGQWDKWYRIAIPRAEKPYDDYLAERRKEMGHERLVTLAGLRAPGTCRRDGRRPGGLRRRRRRDAGRCPRLAAGRDAQAARDDTGAGRHPDGRLVARVSQIENGNVSTQDVLSRFVAALGGTLKLVADFGDEQLKLA